MHNIQSQSNQGEVRGLWLNSLFWYGWLPITKELYDCNSKTGTDATSLNYPESWIITDRGQPNRAFSLYLTNNPSIERRCVQSAIPLCLKTLRLESFTTDHRGFGSGFLPSLTQHVTGGIDRIMLSSVWLFKLTSQQGFLKVLCVPIFCADVLQTLTNRLADWGFVSMILTSQSLKASNLIRQHFGDWKKMRRQLRLHFDWHVLAGNAKSKGISRNDKGLLFVLIYLPWVIDFCVLLFGVATGTSQFHGHFISPIQNR